jgi:hypothetical protein
MKRILVVFGVLDIITLVRSYRVLEDLTTDLTIFPWITLGSIISYSSLAVSAFFLVKQNKLGLWLTYGQFPLRLLFMILSFGFLLTLNRFLGGHKTSYDILAFVAIGLEVARLVITVVIHRRFFLGGKLSLT